MDKKRRNILKGLAAAPLILGSNNLFSNTLIETKTIKSVAKVKFSVNAFTFNEQLRSGEMDFYDMMEFAADLGLDAVDLTGYYFSTYPNIPNNETLFQLKKRALELGLNITWTGVRNNFINPDKIARASDIELIKKWLEVSSKLGASIMRVFPGFKKHKGFTRDQVKEWMVADFKECAKYAKKTGVLLGMQHHNEFLYKADEVLDILKRVDSEWFGLILDIGSVRRGNPYKEIAKLAPYANYWFLKELVYVNGVPEQVNMKKIVPILKENNYKGYISFESLTEGDPKEIVRRMFTDFRNAYGNS
ncbi:sugar phosphate isomerase/epimerase family protein [Polaribacter septentrionalilitoris]|uniref:sugar phosphate isomerase/epimerase family protein n=1 Tax=Polaribacter septentrionalilitoris TaxID=2494657 RepID=UPI00135BB401|nr:sugar phosphate isomerase/epimerase family protein [Polaribacter septentrionalilitoris]